MVIGRNHHRLRHQQSKSSRILWSNEIVGPWSVPDSVKMTVQTSIDFFEGTHGAKYYEVKCFQKMIFMHDNVPSHSVKSNKNLNKMFLNHLLNEVAGIFV